MNAPKSTKTQPISDIAPSEKRILGGATRESNCVSLHIRRTSLNRVLNIIGDWWTQLILRESFLGVRTFSEFQSRLSIPSQTLSQRLKDLVANGIFDDSLGGYRLTPRGLELYPWALMAWSWTRNWGGELGPSHPSVLMHKDCGHIMTPVFACGACRDQVTLRDVEYEVAVTSSRHSTTSMARSKRWRGSKVLTGPDEAGQNIAYITADRWAHLILSAVFLGCRNFGKMEHEIGISTNILAQRLKLLVESGFLEKKPAPKDARRYVYSLTQRSRDVFPLTITLVQWADKWLPVRTTPPQVRYHRGCGDQLHAEVICSHCGSVLLPRSVTFEP